MKFSSLLKAEAGKKFGQDRVSTRGLSEIRYFIYPRCLALAAVIGREGWPSGRLSVIQGLESSGKTTIALQALAECQSKGGVPIYLECESAFEESRAVSLGLYTERYLLERGIEGVEPLVLLRPKDIPQAFAMIEYAVTRVRSENEEIPITVVWDSVAATPPSVEASDDNALYQSQRPGQAAREVSMGFRRLNGILSDTDTVLICTNFIKQKIQTFGFGAKNEDATIAQRALGQHASVRIKLVKIGEVKGDRAGQSKGIRVLARNTKNKIAPPYREAEFVLYYDRGMDDEGSQLEMAKRLSIVTTKGSWLLFEGQTFRAADWPDHVPFRDEIVRRVMERVFEDQEALVRRKGHDGDEEPFEDDDDE